MSAEIPKTTKSLVIQTNKGVTPDGSFIHDAVIKEREIPELKAGQILVKTTAVGFNHKDVWIRKGMYPYITDGSVVGADAAGVVIASADSNDELLNQRVFLIPNRGWKEDPYAPEGEHVILGGAEWTPSGVFSQYTVVERDQVIRVPDHLDDVHAAAWPLGAVTAWRATMVNAGVKPGYNVLITGIGGGVALLALQFCVAAGASVYVTSGNLEKIKKAVELGAKGGVNYHDKDWAAQVHGLLQKEKPGASFNSVIDSAGNEIYATISKYVKQGGRVVVYGATAGPTITMTMHQIVLNQQLIGSTMGSAKDLRDATKFAEEHKIVPVVSHVLEGLENANRGFELLNAREQFGKVIVKV